MPLDKVIKLTKSGWIGASHLSPLLGIRRIGMELD
jgi:hypothetical protein